MGNKVLIGMFDRLVYNESTDKPFEFIYARWFNVGYIEFICPGLL